MLSVVFLAPEDESHCYFTFRETKRYRYCESKIFKVHACLPARASRVYIFPVGGACEIARVNMRNPCDSFLRTKGGND